MARYVLVIPRWQPPRKNQLMRGKLKTRMRLERVTRNIICGYCLLNRMPLAQGPREVRLTVVLGPGQRGGDPDSYMMALGDALVQAKMLIDDNRQYVRWAPTEYERGLERATRVELIDL
jgi:hypothetical protein